MAMVVAKLVIELGVEVDDDLDEDAQIEAAESQFEQMKVKEYVHAFSATTVGLAWTNGSAVTDDTVHWDVPAYIDTEELRVDR